MQNLTSNQILEKIIKGHPNLIAKAGPMLKMMFNEGQVSEGQLNLIWE